MEVTASDMADFGLYWEIGIKTVAKTGTVTLMETSAHW